VSAEVRPIRGDGEYQAALRIRRIVFVEEQGGPLEDEPDAQDPGAHHFVMVEDGEIIGAARIYRLAEGVAKIGRVCVLAEHRGRGLGMVLMRELLRHARPLGAERVVLDAQTHALGFYQRLGFHAVGEEFLDAGIPHRRMELLPVPDTVRQPDSRTPDSHS